MQKEDEDNLAIFTVILMAAFGTKIVHSALRIDAEKLIHETSSNSLQEF